MQNQDNKQTLQLVEQIRQKRDNELNKPEVYTAFELEQLKIKEKNQIDKRDGKNYLVWVSAFHYFNNFTNGSLKFADLDKKFCNDNKAILELKRLCVKQ